MKKNTQKLLLNCTAVQKLNLCTARHGDLPFSPCRSPFARRNGRVTSNPDLNNSLKEQSIKSGYTVKMCIN